MGVAANQVLIQQPGVAENPHRHEPIHGGLEFQQQIHIQPMILKPDSPDDIVMTVTQVIGDVAGVHFLQRREVQRLDPGLRHETLQQVFDHLGVGEQQFVAGVVHTIRVLLRIVLANPLGPKSVQDVAGEITGAHHARAAASARFSEP